MDSLTRGEGGLTPSQLREALTAVRWTQRGLADALECDDRLVRRWASGEAPVPKQVAKWLLSLAGAHQANPPPRDWQARRVRKPE